METFYPFINRYKPINYPYRLLQDLLPFYKSLWISTAFIDHHYKTFPTYYVLYHTHSMADITKQVNEGQERWRQGVDLTSITDVNNYIKFKILEYEYFKFMNNDLWKQY
jgi:hypothetical protein